MLKLSYTYKEQLNNTYQEIVFQKKYRYYNYGSWWDYNIKVEDNSWDNISMISIDISNNILGYFNADINRSSNKVSSLGIMNFVDKNNIIFSKDMYKFIIDLFIKFNMRKIEFEVVIGNPIEKMYDKYVTKYGGKIIGISKEAIKLDDNCYYDVKHYEIFRKDFTRIFQRIHKCKSINNKINKLYNKS